MKFKILPSIHLLMLGIFCLFLNQQNLNAQFIGADFHYNLDKSDYNDTLPISMAQPEMLSMTIDLTKPSKYEVKLKLYFNCFHKDFHKEQPVTIHESVANVQTSQITLLLDSITTSNEYLSVACEMAQEQCLKIAHYSAKVELMQLAGGYDITWGTGCWDFSVTNLNNLEMQGLSMVLHIPDTYDEKNNSSPVFTTIPQVLTCSQKITNVNSSAIDPEGDRLVYEITHPNTHEQLKSFGNMHSDLFPGQHTYKPLIVGRPPFKKLKYAEGYNFKQPLGKSIFTINEQTGSMNIKASEAGRYLVGIAVKEYRNNIQLGETQRVFLLEVMSDPINIIQN